LRFQNNSAQEQGTKSMLLEKRSIIRSLIKILPMGNILQIQGKLHK